jgi:hypothetical protein
VRKQRWRKGSVIETVGDDLRPGKPGVRFPAAKSVRAGDNEAMAMTEQEWLASTDPTPMLEFLRGKASDRKFRLFGVACSRRKWSSLSERQQQFLCGFERLAETQITDPMVLGALGDPLESAQETSDSVAREIAKEDEGPALAAERRQQAGLLLDIFGNPFRPVTIHPTWQTSNVTALAQAICDDRAFDRIPILADALEDAGCDNVDILNHCRQPGEHVRGCWVLDLVLGKE